MRTLKIRDLTLRDGQQSLFATRLPQSSIDALLPHYINAGFYAMEVWGGAVPDSVMRYLDESPWYRLKSISDKINGDKHRSYLTALSRGRNLFGYAPYPTNVIEGFYVEAIKNGLGIMRIFDALNDLDNVKESVEIINKLGGIPDGAVCYTVDPKDDNPNAKKIFTDEYFVEKAKGYEQLGAKIITIKDMAGLVNPARIATLMPKLKAAIRFMKDYAIAHHVVICDYYLPAASCKKRKGTTLTQLWHSGGLMKKFAYDSTQDIDPSYTGNPFANYDNVTISAPCCREVLAHAMRMNENKFFATGLSRTDVYYDDVYNSTCEREFFERYPHKKKLKYVRRKNHS